MLTPLRVVAVPSPSEASVETAVAVSIGDRIRQLQAEAGQLAREHVSLLVSNMAQTQRIAEEIAVGGEAYPPGVRDIARRLHEDGKVKMMALEAVMARLQDGPAQLIDG